MEKCQNGLDLLESRGYTVSFGEHAFDADAYLAGADKDRAADLMAAFDDPSVDAVFCSRGGYGCARLLPYLDFDRIVLSGKLFSGFSDITTLHTALNKRGLITLHAPMLLSLSVERPAWVSESLIAALEGSDPFHPNSPPAETVNPGIAEGVLTGGCLCLLCDSILTAEEIDFDNKIVLIEDVDESSIRVDAMLTHLLNSGKLAKAAGIVVGEMTGTDERDDVLSGARSWKEIVTERLAPLGVPMVVQYPFGHCKGMLSVPLGVRARLDAVSGRLTMLEPAFVGS